MVDKVARTSLLRGATRALTVCSSDKVERATGLKQQKPKNHSMKGKKTGGEEITLSM